ncbi:MAG: hypothetical protein AABY68_08405 [Pseudomonadota bacterium]
MPVIARSQSLPLAPELAERLLKLEPALPLTPPGSDALLYIGWFNDKPISAAWACGEKEGRELVRFAIHPATRGRGVLARLAQEIRELENAAGRRVLSANDYVSLD